MVKIQCDNKGCANKGVPYYFEEEVEVAECGGCKEVLEAQPSDVEAPPQLELPF